MGVIELVNPSEIDIVSICGNTMYLSQLLRIWGTGCEKNLPFAQLVSRLSLISELMVQGRTNIGQLVSQLSLSEKLYTLADPGGYIGRSKDLSLYWNATEYYKNATA